MAATNSLCQEGDLRSSLIRVLWAGDAGKLSLGEQVQKPKSEGDLSLALETAWEFIAANGSSRSCLCWRREDTRHGIGRVVQSASSMMAGPRDRAMFRVNTAGVMM